MLILKNQNGEYVNRIFEADVNFEVLIDYLHKLSLDSKLVFRGFGLSSQMLPNIIRKNLHDYEIELLNRFERFGRSYYSVSNPIDFLSQAQHFGLSTRLLDFTHNPFIALYFSLYNQKNINIKDHYDREYYYVRYCDISEQIYFRQLPSFQFVTGASSNSITYECAVAIASLDRVITNDSKDDKNQFSRDSINAYILTGLWENQGRLIKEMDSNRIDVTLEKFKQKKLLFIEPNQANQRIIMQQGLFLFPYTLDRESLQNQIEKNTKVIKISKKLRPKLRQYLENIGITAYRLMPDLGNICNEIERNIKKDEEY